VKVCFATNNQHKLEEIRSLVPDEIEIVSLRDIECYDELPETHETFEENSEEKARYVFENFKVACFADDSGLEVPAINNEPGVHSAMYAGLHRSDEDNIDLLLQKMVGVTDRKAVFRSIITYIDQQGKMVFYGHSDGEITYERKGTKGFGYDPVFKPLGYDITYGEMSMQEKNKTNHRAIAFDQLIAFLKYQLCQ
jgi:XTP/dITP diphosphohydrolase